MYNNNKKDHLVILQHGLHGTSSDYNTILSYFAKEQFSSKFSNCIIVAAKSNDYFLATHDGIDKVGERLYKEIKELYEKYDRPNKISMIGHSLGGLIARYAIGLLYEDGFFKNCKPIQFISLSSPHCGSRRPTTTLYNKIILYGADKFLSITGKQLILTDKHVIQQEELPLLVHLTEGKFLKGLEMFEKRSLYSNVYYDLQVSFCTSDISIKNPYTLGTKKIIFNEKYKNIINDVVDGDSNIQIPEIKFDDHFKHDTHRDYLKRILNNLNQLTFNRYHMLFNSPLSHTNLIVRSPWLNSDGYDILNHIIDNFNK